MKLLNCPNCSYFRGAVSWTAAKQPFMGESVRWLGYEHSYLNSQSNILNILSTYILEVTISSIQNWEWPLHHHGSDSWHDSHWVSYWHFYILSILYYYLQLQSVTHRLIVLLYSCRLVFIFIYPIFVDKYPNQPGHASFSTSVSSPTHIRVFII